jgi:hypothetical protein
MLKTIEDNLNCMNKGLFAVILLSILASGCIGGGSDTVVDSYNSQVVQLENPGQDTTFVLDKGNNEYKIDTSAQQNASELFSRTENRRVSLRGICSNLQQMMDQEPDTQALGLETLNVRDGQGEIIEANKTMETDELASTLSKYELTRIQYSVMEGDGSVAADCDITGQQTSDLNITFY